MSNTTQTMKENEMQNHEHFDFEDVCPVHETPIRKEYTFGKYRYAEVCVFSGCGCAVAVRHDPVGIDEETASYHDSYNGAAGTANLHKASSYAKYGS